MARGMSSYFTLTLDTAAPELTYDFPSKFYQHLGPVSLEVTFVDEVSYYEAYVIDNDIVRHDLISGEEADGSINFDIDCSEMADGVGTLYVEVRDELGNPAEIEHLIRISTEFQFLLELYGATYGLSIASFLRLKKGFTYIRNCEGWQDFSIPYYVWDYVSQADRDDIFSRLTTIFYEYRTAADFIEEETDQDARFCYFYTLVLYQRWWAEASEIERASRYVDDGHLALIASDMNIPSANLSIEEDIELGSSIFIQDFDALDAVILFDHSDFGPDECIAFYKPLNNVEDAAVSVLSSEDGGGDPPVM